MKELLEGIKTIKSSDPWARILILAPSRNALWALKKVLAAEGSWAGLEIMTHQGLASRCHEALGGTPVTLLPSGAADLLLDRVLRSGPRGDSLADYVRSFMGSRSLLLGAFRELREARIPASGLAQAEIKAQDRSLASLYGAYEKVLAEAKKIGLLDSADFTLKSLAGLKPYLSGKHIRQAFHYDSGELVEIYEEQLRELGKQVSLVRFSRYAPSPSPEGRGSSPEKIHFAQVQGAENEVRAAVKALAAWHLKDGIPLSEMAVLARSLEPYASLLRKELKTFGIPFHPGTEAAVPALESGEAQVLHLFLRVLEGGLEREETFLLLDHPDRKTPQDETGTACSRWLSACRGWGTLSGSAELLRASRRERGGRDASAWESEARKRLEAWDGISRRLDRAYWKQGLEFLREEARSLLDQPSALWATLLEAADSLSALFRDEPKLKLGDLVRWLKTRLEESVEPTEEKGLPLLSLMEARGMTFRRAILLGAQEGLLPRRPRPDVFLHPLLRKKLAASYSGLALKDDPAGEERALWTGFLGSVGDRLLILRQRADEEGRAKAASPYLREMAESELRISNHPAEQAGDWLGADWEKIAGPSPLAPSEAALGLTQGLNDPWLALPKELESLAPAGLSLPRVLEALADHNNYAVSGPLSLRRDGMVPAQPEGLPRRWSPNNLAELGNCPLRFFFIRILRARAGPEAPDPALPGPVEIGNSLHEALDILGKNPGLSPAEALDKASAFRDLKGRLDALQPALTLAARGKFAAWLEEFRAWDKKTLEGLGTARVKTELRMERNLDGLPLHGRADRLIELPDGGKIVQDMKSGGRIKNHVDKADMLKGRRLQVPLYAWLSGKEGEDLPKSEILALGPAAEGLDEKERTAKAPHLDKIIDGVLETVRLLVQEAALGRFPYGENAPCSYCEFRAACRHGEAPTDQRVLESSAYAVYQKIQMKNTKARTLAEMDSGGSEGEAEEE